MGTESGTCKTDLDLGPEAALQGLKAFWQVYRVRDEDFVLVETNVKDIVGFLYRKIERVNGKLRKFWISGNFGI